MDPNKLKEFVEAHGRWLRNEANGARADLAGADLAGAYLRGAYLRGTYLRGAHLAGADLAGADLRDANLAGADLAGAYLARADLRDANLAGANLAGANLTGAHLAGAHLAGADLAGTGLVVPTVEALHCKILEQIKKDPTTFDMGTWHSQCGTAHCRAGWAVHLAGEAGYALEKRLGAELAGALITLASSPELGGVVPDFYADNAEAKEDIERLAALEKARGR